MTMQVEFVSPEDILYSGEAESVVARTRGGGEIAFLEGHVPFIGSLMISEVKVAEADESVQSFVVRGGFISVTGTKVTVLSDAALATENIDIAQVEEDLTNAQAAIEEAPEDVYNSDDLRWAQVQLAAAGVETPVG